jgi:predicted metal-dependent HD superfamily phosphohydrolase
MRGLNMMNQNRWQTLMSAMGLPPSKLCYDALHAAYSEKRRFYHTVDHIDAMLTHFDGVKDIAERPEELELAIWFHDAIYKPLSKTNELNRSLSISIWPFSAPRPVCTINLNETFARNIGLCPGSSTERSERSYYSPSWTGPVFTI